MAPRRNHQSHAIVLEVDGQPVDVIFKAIKNINISVRHPDGRVRVSAPFHVGEAGVRAAIRARATWIAGHQARIRATPRHPPSALQDGDHVLLWGALHRLEVGPSPRARAVVGEGVIHLTCPTDAPRELRQRALDRLYRRELNQAVGPVFAHWERIIGQSATKVVYRRMKTKWGTCQPRTGVIRLNTELAKYHPSGLAYVVVHELVHLLEASHNQRFYAFMDAFMPDWRVHRQHLNAAGLAEG